jgi:hypothetical protein
MRRIITIAVAAALLALGGAAPGLADDTVPFQAQLIQPQLVSVSCVAGICDGMFEGTGAANTMGSITWTAHVVQDFTVSPCNPTEVEIILVGATGSITVTGVETTVCHTPHGPSFISGDWVITEGTGEFGAITGSGTSQGVIIGRGPIVHLSGGVSY